MKAKIKIERPDDVSATMEITMTVGQWKKVAWKMGKAPDRDGHCPTSGAFSSMIDSLIGQAEAGFSETQEKEGL